MNDLQVQDPKNVTTNFVLDSMLNPQVFEQMQRASNLFSKSGLVPQSFQNNPAACFVGLQLAGAIGCNPFMLFQGLYSIGGKIGLEAKVAIAIANQKGVFESPITHEFTGEGTTRACTAKAVLAKSKKEVSLTVDWATVEKEGWNKRNGSKWNTIPDQMFRYRSSMWLIRTYAPEVLMGLNSIEEIQDAGIIDITPKAKTIDSAFAEMAKEEPKKEEEKPVEAETVVEAPTTNPVIDTILSYGIAPSMLTVYTVKAIGKNKPVELLTKEEADKLLTYISKIKGENK